MQTHIASFRGCWSVLSYLCIMNAWIFRLDFVCESLILKKVLWVKLFWVMSKPEAVETNENYSSIEAAELAPCTGEPLADA